ncbi:hypothetical protein LFT45_09035 [Arthrobacter sp. FW305-BF8]|uniref:hypothetical protein n=1 Tax=Arthrobacter sp. FW305-BF8 TaxID=2879617 RepID=UPI001F2D2ECD|nr:hypothetical protein [Arthrobacter sp. FW305-BF8]UKA56034.1 hypothetical protein LFT45_09035 [Arthrobacter sp. FW305-BF8]
MKGSSSRRHSPEQAGSRSQHVGGQLPAPRQRQDLARQDADHARARAKGGRARRLRRAELLLIGAGVAATLVAAAYQYAGIRSTLESSTASSLYAQQQEIDRIFVDNVDLQPYFWRRQELPDAAAVADPAAKRAAQQLAGRAEATAHRILDHFAHLKYQMGTQAFTSERADWEAYIRRSFADSLILCRALRDDREAFGGTGADSLWGRYAEEPCAGT